MKKKVKKEKAVVVSGIKSQSPAMLIQQAVANQADLEKLEKLLSLQERWQANEAKKAYHKAMSEFKANPPKIEKDKKIKYNTNKGSVGYSHASLANVTEKINEALSKHGLSASWTTKQNEAVIVTCKITHVMGHSEETSLSAPADISGAKNPIQAIGSTITYLERYTLLALTGLATYDQDDDAKNLNVEFIDKAQQKKIKDLIKDLNVDVPMFLDYMGIEKLEDMPKADFQKAIVALESKRRKAGQEK